MATFRKIIQISTGTYQRNNEATRELVVLALCNDGSMWFSPDYCAWSKWDVSAITDSQASDSCEP